MKGLKKALSVLAAAALTVTTLMGSATVASADTTITDNSKLNSHSYSAYQVLTGDQESGSSVLTNVAWGSGIDSTAFVSALKTNTATSTYFANAFGTDASDDATNFADVLSENNNNTALAEAVAQLAYENKTKTDYTNIAADTSISLPAGYYLIVDETSLTGTTDDVLNGALLQVTDSITIANKTSKPTVEKKVQENSTNTVTDAGYGAQYNDVADYSIGDSVPFKLIGTVPDTSNYNKYLTYTFTDTLDTGLTAPASTAVSVFYATSKDATTGTDLSSYFNVTVNGQTITVALKSGVDLKNVVSEKELVAGNYIIVTYNATVNANANIGYAGNENKVKLTYSSNPNFNGNGTTTPDETEDTKEDEVVVFVYELDTTKVDSANTETKLADATFVLLNSDKSEVATFDSDSKFVKWVTVESITSGSTITYTDAMKLTSGSNGTFKAIGLDEGTYYLKEIVAPKDYNLLTEDVTVVISATTVNNQNYNGTPSSAITSIDVTANGIKGSTDTYGVASITVANSKGSTLPSTGGMGTRIFLLIGALAVVAGVVMKSRRKLAK